MRVCVRVCRTAAQVMDTPFFFVTEAEVKAGPLCSIKAQHAFEFLDKFGAGHLSSGKSFFQVDSIIRA